MLHLTINPATSTLRKLTATHDEKSFFFFFLKKHAKVIHNDKWVGLVSQVDWSHPIPGWSQPSYSMILHLKCIRCVQKTMIKPESNISSLKMARGQSQSMSCLFSDLHCPLWFHRFSCEQFTLNKMDYSTTEKILSFAQQINWHLIL